MRIRIILLLTIILISSCAKPNSFITPIMDINSTPIVVDTFNSEKMLSTSISPEGCLPPLNPLGFPVGREISGPPNEYIPPASSSGWISSLPWSDEQSRSGTNLSLIVRKNQSGHEELWLLDAGKGTGKIFRYDLELEKWLPTVTSNNIQRHQFIVKDIHNSIWIAGDTITELNPSTVFLERYDDSSNTFEPILDIKTLFSEEKNLPDNIQVITLQVDKNGLFWFVVKDNSYNIISDSYNYYLYSYNPDNSNLELHLPTNPQDWSGQIAIGPENTIFLLDYLLRAILQYFPESKSVSKYEVLVSSDTQLDYRSLYFDKQNRLWVGGLGWFDFSSSENYQWYEFLKPPELVAYLSSQGIWFASSPNFTYEGTNGILWFTAPYRGTGWVNPNNGEWCIFTTYESNIVEDSNHNLWMVAEGKLYKLSLD